MNLKNFEIHIVHYELLKERRSYLEKRLKYFGLEKFCFWHIQKINQDFSNIKKKYYKFDKDIWMERIKSSHNKITLSIMPRELSHGDMKLGINELKLFDFLAKRKGNKIYLILEDDVILEENFLDKLKKILRILPKDFDIAYTDFGINDAKEYLSVDNLQFKKLDKNHKKTRTTASFFINSKSAKKFSQDIKPFTLPLDHELRYWEVKKNYNTYWLNGYLTYQGTIYGDIYPSSLFPTRVKEYYQRIPFYKKIILDFIKNTEAKRFNKSIFSKIQVNLLDLLIFLKNSISVLDKR